MMNIGCFILLVLVAIFGTLGNIFIIGAVCLSKRLCTISYAFVVNLAIADIIITGYIMPAGLATSESEDLPFSDGVCDFNAFLTVCSLAASITTLMVIAIERYLHICHMDWYKKIFTKKTTGLYILLIWVWSVIWAVQGYTGWTDYYYFDDAYICIFDGTDLSYNACLVVLGMIVPIAILTFSYVNIYRTVRTSHAAIFKNTEENLSNQQLKLKSEYRLAGTLFIIVIIFIICWIPTGVVLALVAVHDLNDTVTAICVWLSMSNSSMNSIIYGVMNKTFRKGYRRLFSQIFFCFPKVKVPESTSLKTEDDNTVMETKGSEDQFQEANTKI